MEAHSGVHDALEGLQEDEGVGGLAARDPVVMVVLRQLVYLLQRQARAHAAQVWRYVKALRFGSSASDQRSSLETQHTNAQIPTHCSASMLEC